MRGIVLVILALCLFWPAAGCGSQKSGVEMPDHPAPKPTKPPMKVSVPAGTGSTPVKVPEKTP
ncbi:MAG: hypothetical protein A2V70_12060 [Planctomycetes bacterium RBG_13_63_9]|nr:MAG: hypothetical protein A2V70_12060 [Planctomycetes bacterium RBG_13_63_9]